MQSTTQGFRSGVERLPIGQLTTLPAAEKRALLERLLAEKREQRKIYPLSFAQSRIWFHQQLAPGSSNHHILQAVRLHTRLDAGLLQSCWNEVVRRHDALRTRVETFESGAMQIVDPLLEVRLEVIDLTSIPADECDEAVRAAANRLFAEPFDLARGPLLRVAVAHLHGEESVVILVMHHIIGDNQSVQVIFREVKTLYEAAAAGGSITLAEPHVQYGEFSRWQRSVERDASRTGQLSYWRKRLDGIQPIELPTDHPRAQAVEAVAGRISSRPFEGSHGTHSAASSGRKVSAFSW